MIRRSARAPLLSMGLFFFLAYFSPANAETQVKDFQAHVRQTRMFSDIGEEVVFNGTVVYARPGRMRWEFTEPDASTLLIRPQDAWLIIPGIKQVQKIGAQGHKRIEGFLLGFEKSWKDWEKDYRVERAGQEQLAQGKADLIKLFKPSDGIAPEIWIWWDSARGIPLRVKWINAQGDPSVTDFFDIRVNAGVDDKAFDAAVPAGFETALVEDF